MNRLESALHALGDDLPDPSPVAGPPVPSDLADRALARAHRRARRATAATVLGAATLATVVAVGLATAFSAAPSRPDTPAATASRGVADPGPLARPRVNVLLIGSDAAPDRIGVRPDTIMLASVDTRSGDTALFSLPRSLERVPFAPGSPGARAWPKGFDCGSACLLNAVWTWAGRSRDYAGSADPGLAATTDAVEGVTGLTVDETAVITMAGLADLIDALGGVDVTVRERLPVGGSADASSPSFQRAGRWLEPGRRHLNGPDALWYARSRWSTDDRSRTARQRCLAASLADQVHPATLLTAYPELLRTLRANLTTSIEADELPDWIALLGRVRSGSVQGVELSADRPDRPDFDALRTLVARTLAAGDPGPTPAPAGGGGAGPTC